MLLSRISTADMKIMNIDFAFYLTMAVIFTGLIWLTDSLFFAARRQATVGAQAKLPLIVDYAKSFCPLLILVLILRSFLVQFMEVPTGSLEPTIIPVEFIMVNMFSYGLRLPVLNKKIVSIGEPQRGDIMVFRWPTQPGTNLVKRVIGIPGDHISYINKVLYINSKAALQESLGPVTDAESQLTVTKLKENLLGITHDIYINPNQPVKNFYNLIIPNGEYFMMGDNRDDSIDSRYWGFVPESFIIGKAERVCLSWDRATHRVRWSRIGAKL